VGLFPSEERVMNEKAKVLNGLIEISRDGMEFYREAAGKVSDGSLKTLFNRMAQAKADLVQALSTEVRLEGEKPATKGTVVGEFQKLYGELRAKLGDQRYGYVAELEQVEDRLLKAFNDAAFDDDSPLAVRTAASLHLPEVRACHDEMARMKKAYKKVA
jgi:uncharacterized protein (TIGR02284 family)